MATYSGTPRTWVAGETVTAALLNSDLRDPLAALAGAWNTFTPTLTQGVAVTKTVNYAKYLRVGKLVVCTVKLYATSTGTAGSAIITALPLTAAATASFLVIGSANVYDTSSGTHYNGVVEIQSGGASVGVLYPGGGLVGANPNFAMASSDSIGFTILYEAA